jgi:bifunctional non-homologous end joining protein LigD
VGRGEVALTSLERVLWPATGFTKGDMLDYYERIAPVLVPHISGRPLTLGRFPDGVDGPAFAQTECRGRPDWMATAPIRLRSGEVRNYCLVNDARSLLWVANLGTIELHPFLARAEKLDRPLGVLFDLDPEEPAGLADCARVALTVRAALDELGLSAVVKTTGSAGLHVVAPLGADHTYEDTRPFARGIAERLASEDPAIAASAARREERAGQVLVDWSQNSERRSTISVYSLRAADIPLVSAPVTWGEVERCARGEQRLMFAPASVLERMDRLGDLFQGAVKKVQRLR